MIKRTIIIILPIIILAGCSIQRWEGKSIDALLSKKGKPDKVEQNGEEKVLYYCKPQITEAIDSVDREGNVAGQTTADTTYNYEVFAIQKSNTIFFASEEISYLAPEKFSVIEE